MAKRNRGYFFEDVSSNDRFLETDEPTEQVFRDLFDSIPFFNELSDTSKSNQQGLVKKSTDANAKSYTTPADGFSYHVSPHNLPQVVSTDNTVEVEVSTTETDNDKRNIFDLSVNIGGGATEDISYDDLLALRDGGTLDVRKTYRLAYQTVHLVPYTGILNTDQDVIDNFYQGESYAPETEHLLIRVASANAVIPWVDSEEHPNDLIYWDIDSNVVPNSGGFSRDGFIRYRRDVFNEIEAWYDFRNCVVKRWVLDNDGSQEADFDSLVKQDSQGNPLANLRAPVATYGDVYNIKSTTPPSGSMFICNFVGFDQSVVLGALTTATDNTNYFYAKTITTLDAGLGNGQDIRNVKIGQVFIDDDAPSPVTRYETGYSIIPTPQIISHGGNPRNNWYTPVLDSEVPNVFLCAQKLVNVTVGEQCSGVSLCIGLAKNIHIGSFCANIAIGETVATDRYNTVPVSQSFYTDIELGNNNTNIYIASNVVKEIKIGDSNDGITTSTHTTNFKIGDLNSSLFLYNADQCRVGDKNEKVWIWATSNASVGSYNRDVNLIECGVSTLSNPDEVLNLTPPFGFIFNNQVEKDFGVSILDGNQRLYLKDQCQGTKIGVNNVDINVVASKVRIASGNRFLYLNAANSTIIDSDCFNIEMSGTGNTVLSNCIHVRCFGNFNSIGEDGYMMFIRDDGTQIGGNCTNIVVTDLDNTQGTMSSVSALGALGGNRIGYGCRDIYIWAAAAVDVPATSRDISFEYGVDFLIEGRQINVGFSTAREIFTSAISVRGWRNALETKNLLMQFPITDTETQIEAVSVYDYYRDVFPSARLGILPSADNNTRHKRSQVRGEIITTGKVRDSVISNSTNISISLAGVTYSSLEVVAATWTDDGTTVTIVPATSTASVVTAQVQRCSLISVNLFYTEGFQVANTSIINVYTTIGVTTRLTTNMINQTVSQRDSSGNLYGVTIDEGTLAVTGTKTFTA